MLRIDYFYWLIGAFLLITTLYNLREGRYSTAAFWAIACAFALPSPPPTTSVWLLAPSTERYL